MDLFCTWEEAYDMTQEQLKSLGFPLAEAWDVCAREPVGDLDGQTLQFVAESHRAAIANCIDDGIRTGKRFLVLVTYEDKAMLEEQPIWTGKTVFLAGADLIRYQPVICEARFKRMIGNCTDGFIYEFNAEHISAWSGMPIGRAVSTFLNQKKYLM